MSSETKLKEGGPQEMQREDADVLAGGERSREQTDTDIKAGETKKGSSLPGENPSVVLSELIAEKIKVEKRLSSAEELNEKDKKALLQDKKEISWEIIRQYCETPPKKDFNREKERILQEEEKQLRISLDAILGSEIIRRQEAQEQQRFAKPENLNAKYNEILKNALSDKQKKELREEGTLVVSSWPATIEMNGEDLAVAAWMGLDINKIKQKGWLPLLSKKINVGDKVFESIEDFNEKLAEGKKKYIESQVRNKIEEQKKTTINDSIEQTVLNIEINRIIIGEENKAWKNLSQEDQVKLLRGAEDRFSEIHRLKQEAGSSENKTNHIKKLSDEIRIVAEEISGRDLIQDAVKATGYRLGSNGPKQAEFQKYLSEQAIEILKNKGSEFNKSIKEENKKQAEIKVKPEVVIPEIVTEKITPTETPVEEQIPETEPITLPAEKVQPKEKPAPEVAPVTIANETRPVEIPVQKINPKASPKQEIQQGKAGPAEKVKIESGKEKMATEEEKDRRGKELMAEAEAAGIPAKEWNEMGTLWNAIDSKKGVTLAELEEVSKKIRELISKNKKTENPVAQDTNKLKKKKGEKPQETATQVTETKQADAINPDLLEKFKDYNPGQEVIMRIPKGDGSFMEVKGIKFIGVKNENGSGVVIIEKDGRQESMTADLFLATQNQQEVQSPASAEKKDLFEETLKWMAQTGLEANPKGEGEVIKSKIPGVKEQQIEKAMIKKGKRLLSFSEQRAGERSRIKKKEREESQRKPKGRNPKKRK